MEQKEMLKIIAKLEKDPPDVYVKCKAPILDEKGVETYKRCNLNLKTGEIFRNRALACNEIANTTIARIDVENKRGCLAQRVSNLCYNCATIIDDYIVITKWIYGDHINQPNTSDLNIDGYYYPGCEISLAKATKYRTHQNDESGAIASISIAQPKIAAALFIDKNKHIEAWEDVQKYGHKRHNCTALDDYYLARRLLGIKNSASSAKEIVGILECFKSFFGVGYVGANKYVTFDDCAEIPRFLQSSMLQKKNNKFQNYIDELVKIDLPNHENEGNIEETICYADKVNNEYVVLRWHTRTISKNYIETTRMYINKKDALQCRSDLNGGWIGANRKLKAETFKADRVVLQYPNVFDDTKLEYFKNISTEMSNQSAALYMLTMYPEFEKMYKIGLDWICKDYIAQVYNTSWLVHMDDYVGDVDWKATNIFKMLGLNNYQIKSICVFREQMIDKITGGMYYTNKIIKSLKGMFDTSTLNDIDNQTFDYMLNTITPDRLINDYVYAVALTRKNYPKNALSYIRDLNAIDSSKIVTVTSRYWHTMTMSVDTLYRDMMGIIHQGRYANRIKPRFSTLDELVSHHNMLVDLFNADESSREAYRIQQYEDNFKTNTTRWKAWEWEDDSDFCVIAPTAPIDIAEEGIALRHCVKSYIPSLAEGRTNVVFIRRRENKTEPFFTVEIDNNHNIRQIHGMCNCNADSVDGLTDFVKRWSKAKKLKYKNTSANRVLAAG